MFGALFKKNSIPKIARVMPPALIEAYEKKNFYSLDEVKSSFEDEFKYEHNIEYAFAMFCAQPDFEELNLESTYDDLRIDVSKKCFGSWPLFNFESLLAYSQNSGVGGFAGAGGDGGGCGDGGC